MRHETVSSIKHLSGYRSLWMLALAICLCPAAAEAQANPRVPIEATNTATGAGALSHLDSGVGYNTATGYTALNQTTGGESNTASGASALRFNTTGNNNVAVGVNALSAINGNNNIALGYNAGKNTTSGNNNIYVGHPGNNGSESRVIRIGKAQTRTFIAGIAGKALSGATVVVRPNGQLGVVASSARYKRDIRALTDASAKLARLRPVSYRYKTEPEATHYGLIAEEVETVMPELVVRDDQDRPESVQYQELIPLLLQQWKAQQAEIVTQRDLNARQQAIVDVQAQRIAALERRLAALETTLRQSSRREAAMQRTDSFRAGH